MNNTKAASIKKVHKADCQLQVLKALKEHGCLTRSDLAKITGLKLSSVCGRVNELIKLKRIFVIGFKLDTETNRNVELVMNVGSNE